MSRDSVKWISQRTDKRESKKGLAHYSNTVSSWRNRAENMF